jgi:hypothetical protein
VQGTHDAVAKLLAWPEFVLVIALARVAGTALRARGLPALPILLVVKVCFLLAFFVFAVSFGPFPDLMRRQRCSPASPASPAWRSRMRRSAFTSPVFHRKTGAAD